MRPFVANFRGALHSEQMSRSYPSSLALSTYLPWGAGSGSARETLTPAYIAKRESKSRSSVASRVAARADRGGKNPP